MKEQRTAQIRNSMHILRRTEKKIAQPSLRHSRFTKEKIPPRRRADTKINVEELKDTQVDRGGVKIFTLNTPTKTREKIKIKVKILPHASRFGL